MYIVWKNQLIDVGVGVVGVVVGVGGVVVV